MGKINAPIDNKNVTTDWIEYIFDHQNAVQYDNQMLGFIEGQPVYAYWYNNTIMWKCVGENVTDEIRKRLAKEEDSNSELFSECYYMNNAIIQNFFFHIE